MLKTDKRVVLVTGGAGYVGSNICLALIQSGFEPIVLDSLVTGRKEFADKFINYIGEYGDKILIKKIFSEHPNIEFCIHCAALVLVPQSVDDPYSYYKVNVVQSIELFKTLTELGCKKIVYSSTGSVYENLPKYEVNEQSLTNPHSPVSRTKLFTELILKDFCKAYGLSAITLRYFNPIGASPDCQFGLQDKNPSHLIGKLMDVAIGKDKVFKFTGVSWDTSDGTAIKDFIHVWDLAEAHVMVLKNFDNAISHCLDQEEKYLILNIGSGKGITIREFVSIFENVYGKKINKQDAPERPGDVIGQYANVDLAKKLIHWKPKLSVEDAISSTLNWWKIRDKILNYINGI